MPTRFALLLALTILAGCDAPETSPPSGTPSASPEVAPTPASVVEPPAYNVLFVSFDTTRKDRLSCYGYDKPTTPRLDQVAAAGHRFNRAYTVVPTTLPSHLAMFTSRYPGQLAVRKNGHKVRNEAVLLPEVLSAAGVATGGFVSAQPIGPDSGFNQGFDRFDGPRKAERTADQTTDAALAWLGERTDEQPWFCFLHLFDPHTWYEPPPHTAALFDAPTKHDPKVRGFISNKYEKNELRHLLAAYDAELRYADEQLGRVLDWLDESGAREKTIIVFTSDHGETLMEGGRYYVFSHGGELHNWELNVPLLVWLPPGLSIAGEKVHDTPVSTLDLMPTLLDLLGLPKDDAARGQSLRAMLDGSYEPTPRKLFAEMKGGKAPFSQDEFAVIDGDWMTIKRNSRVNPMALYNVTEDPREKKNLAKERKTRVAAARNAVKKLRESLRADSMTARPKMDQEALDALKTLGYVGDDGDEEEDD